jgi:hypothetical protein
MANQSALRGNMRFASRALAVTQVVNAKEDTVLEIR